MNKMPKIKDMPDLNNGRGENYKYVRVRCAATIFYFLFNDTLI